MRAGHDEPVGEVDPLDAALDRELQLALRVDPSPALAARVRTEIASAPAATPVGFAWLYAVSAMAVVAVLVVAVVSRRPDAVGDVDSGTPSSLSRSVSAARTGEPAPAAASRPAAGASATAHPVRASRRARPDNATVQFSPAEGRALRKLVMLANQQDASLADLLASSTLSRAAEIRIAELQIPPVTIERLEPESGPEPGTY